MGYGTGSFGMLTLLVELYELMDTECKDFDKAEDSVRLVDNDEFIFPLYTWLVLPSFVTK